MIVEAHIEFQSDEQVDLGTGRGTKIQYVTRDSESAVHDAKRWWDNRNRHLNDWFHRLCAVKIYAIHVQQVQPDGYLPSDHGFAFFEWKLDYGPYGIDYGRFHKIETD